MLCNLRSFIFGFGNNISFPGHIGSKKCTHIRRSFRNIQIWFSLKLQKMYWLDRLLDALFRMSFRRFLWNINYTPSLEKIFSFKLNVFQFLRRERLFYLDFLHNFICSLISTLEYMKETLISDNLSWNSFYFNVKLTMIIMNLITKYFKLYCTTIVTTTKRVIE